MQTSLTYYVMNASMLTPSYVLSCGCGAAVMLALTRLGASNLQLELFTNELRAAFKSLR
jgi:hypothetical protein